MKKSYLSISSNLVKVATMSVLVLLLVACGAANPPAASPTLEGEQAPLPTSDSGATTAEAGYPPPAAAPETTAGYPAEGEGEAAVAEAYPPPAVDQAFKEPRFSFDRPVQANANTVSGQAPPDIALVIADLTFNGAILGSGRSDSDGRFSISVSPLPDDHRIGITVAELQPGQTISDMSAAYYPHRGDSFMNLPNIGVFFETALVEP